MLVLLTLYIVVPLLMVKVCLRRGKNRRKRDTGVGIQAKGMERLVLVDFVLW